MGGAPPRPGSAAWVRQVELERESPNWRPLDAPTQRVSNRTSDPLPAVLAEPEPYGLAF